MAEAMHRYVKFKGMHTYFLTVFAHYNFSSSHSAAQTHLVLADSNCLLIKAWSSLQHLVE